MDVFVRKAGDKFCVIEAKPVALEHDVKVLGVYSSRRQAIREAEKLGHSVIIQNRETDGKEGKGDKMGEILNINICTSDMIENGRYNGEWLNLPAKRQDIDFALMRLGVAEAEYGVDYHIAQFESSLPVIANLPIEHLQRKSIEELNELAEALEKYDTELVMELNSALERLQEKYNYKDNTRNTSGRFSMATDGLVQSAFGMPYRKPEIAAGQMSFDSAAGAAAVMSNVKVKTMPVNKAGTDKPTERKPITTYDKVKETLKQLEKGIESVFESEKYQAYLNTLSKFHKYSFNNNMLITMQKPDATYVAGFNFWRDNLNRHVKKGERGIKILAPSTYQSMRQVERTGRDGRPLLDKTGNPVHDLVKVEVPCFKTVSVFDVSQTYGEPMPSLGVDELRGADDHKDLMAAVRKTSRVPVMFEPMDNDAKGSYDFIDKRIVVREGMSGIQSLKTMIHEIAHSRLHDTDAKAKPDEKQIDARTREVQAESIAYTVCRHYGLDTSDYSFGYIAAWSGGKDITELKESLGVIRKEAHAIIDSVDGHLLEFSKERERAVNKAAIDAVKSNSRADNVVTVDSKTLDVPEINADISETAKTKQTAKAKAKTTARPKAAGSKPSIKETLANAKKEAARRNAAPKKSKETEISI